MKIALVTHAYSRFGGTEKYVFDLSRWLVSRGHEVSIFCATTDIKVEERAGVSVFVYPHSGRRGLLGTLQWLRGSAAVPRKSYDVVQGFGRTIQHDVFRAGGGVHRVWIDRRYRGIERLLLWTSVKGWLDRWIDRAAFDNAKIVICNSEMVAAEVCAVRGIQPHRVRVVRNGVDCDRFQPDAARKEIVRKSLNIPEDGRLVMFVGNGYRRKGVLTAGRSFERSCGPTDRFVVIGKEARHAYYCRQLRERLGDRLVYVGAVEDTAAWLPAADALLLPTMYDPAANITLEAMACAVPPIVSRFDGNHEVLPFAELVVDQADDVDGFAKALGWALDRPDEQREELRRVAERWPVSRNGEKMETLYREIANA